MNELTSKKIKWQCFHEQEWTNLEELQDIIIEIYHDICDYHTVPRFEHFRETAYFDEEIMLPITSYYAFQDEHKWKWYEEEDSELFIDTYEDTFPEVENDLLAVLYENRIFIEIHWNNEFYHMPMVQVW